MLHEGEGNAGLTGHCDGRSRQLPGQRRGTSSTGVHTARQGVPSPSGVPKHGGTCVSPRLWGGLPWDGQAEPRSSKPRQTGSAGRPREPPCFPPSPGAAGPPGRCGAASGSTLLHLASEHRRNRHIMARPRDTPAIPAPQPGAPHPAALSLPRPGASSSWPQPPDTQGSAGNNFGVTSPVPKAGRVLAVLLLPW